MIDQAQVIAELTRVKALFQQRAVLGALGVAPHQQQAPRAEDEQPHDNTKGEWK